MAGSSARAALPASLLGATVQKCEGKCHFIVSLPCAGEVGDIAHSVTVLAQLLKTAAHKIFSELRSICIQRQTKTYVQSVRYSSLLSTSTTEAMKLCKSPQCYIT